MINLFHRYKVNKALKSMGISTKHKTANDVFNELSKQWNDLSEDKQKEISIILAGKEHANYFIETVIKNHFRFQSK